MTTLNEAQKRATEALDGPLLIVAGAGSGKTKVIAHRILNLVKNGVAPHQILAITFTNKAAKEMRDRVTALITQDPAVNIPISMTERPYVSTFHALGVHIIRENCKLLDLPRHFSIYDRSDSKKAVKEALLISDIDPKKYDPAMFLGKISKAKSEGMSYLTFKDSAKDFMEEMTAEVWEKYENILKKEKALDFDDLLLKTLVLLKKDGIKKHYSSVWKYVHIDEYQDTNKIQYEISKYLTMDNKNICVVGDADQNIYSWRGATIENILNFEKDYPEATVITLEKNYRSTKTILEAANMVIEKNTYRKKKHLYTDNPVGEKISLINSYTETDEARAIADTVNGLISRGVSSQEIAVLYRTNFQSRAIEEAFIKKNIPYQLLGTKFFERKEVKDVISYIKASLNPDSGSDIARIINIPPRGIGKVTLAKVLNGQESELPDSTRQKINNWRELLKDLRSELTESRPSDAVRFVIQETGIDRMYTEGHAEDEERLLNIRELVSVASQYDHMEKGQGIEAFLDNVALATDQDEMDEKTDSVKLMTVHAAKGLEFDHVFIAGMEQDLFPFKHMDEKEISERDSEEERRLFYVALTRARKKVHLSYALIRNVFGTERVNTPSEFIEDIEKHLIENHEVSKPSGVKAIFIDF